MTGAHFEKVNFFGGKFYYGYIVELFFVLSGFFMYGYIKKIKNGMPFKSYIIKKAVRLLPLVAIAAVTYEVFLICYNTITGETWFDIHATLWGTVISGLGMQEGWGFKNLSVNYPTWYISVLLLCYVIFFILTWLSERLDLNEKYLYVMMILIGVGVSTNNLNLPFFNPATSRGYYAFFFGLLLAAMLEKRKIRQRDYVLCIILAVGISIMIGMDSELVKDGVNYIMTFLVYPSVIIIFQSKIVSRIFRAGLWSKLGKISFDVYIWHNPFFIVLFIINKYLKFNLNSVKGMVLYTIICFLIGTGPMSIL